MTPVSGKSKIRRLPGEEGIWLFIVGDMLMFALLFLTFIYYRGDNIDIYRSSQKLLNERFGLTNTLLLLTSSLFVALATRGVRTVNQKQRVGPYLPFAISCGLGFVAVKIAEYSEKFGAGITILTNDFFMFYFMFTVIHLVHVLIGLGVLIMMSRLTRKAALDPVDIRTFESGAAFWHLVDLLWVILFALFYLVR